MSTQIKIAALSLTAMGMLALSGCGGGSGGNSNAIAPTATAGRITATTGAQQSGTLAGKGSSPLTYVITVPPQDGTASLTDPATGTFTYTSYPNFTGTDTFQFTVKNSIGTSPPVTESESVVGATPGAQQMVADIGVSTDWVCYWCEANPYVDVMHQANGFQDLTSGASLDQTGELDANGWPEVDFQILVLMGNSASDNSHDDPGTNSILSGNYQLSFNGEATISDWGYGKILNQSYDAATNTTTATVDATDDPNGDGGLTIGFRFSKTMRTATSPVDTGVTNIQLLRPQNAPNGQPWWSSPTQEFTTPFLNSFKGFSTIRYINWTQVINSPEVDWSDRTPGNWPVAHHFILPPSSSLPYLSGTGSNGWYSTGDSWEHAIDLANATHTDMWINIPVMATDDYVKSLATLIESKLDPGLHVYVEWSDEIWNYGNPFWTETDYNADQTTALLADNPMEAANYSANCPAWDYDECHLAERLMQFSEDFASVYGQSAINTIIRPVYCMQVVQPSLTQNALSFIAETYRPPANYFYAICGAPYWSPASALASDATEQQVVAALDQSIPANAQYIQADTATALFYGLHNFTYEGGPGLNYISGPSASVLQAADMDAAMQAQVSQALTAAFQQGEDMYMYYIGVQGGLYTGGYWGATPDVLDPGAPKFAALTALAGQSVTRNAGTALPGSVPVNPPLFGVVAGTLVPTFEVTGGYCEPVSGSASAYCAFNGSTPVGNGYGYLVDVPAAGNYSVSVVMDDRQGNSASSVQLEVDQHSLATIAIPKTPAGTPLTLGPVSVTLGAGLHLVEMLNASSGNFAVDNINITSH